ncbi:helix-hairpin-helix domain-containing protein [Alicyclobacillus tolerans]|uniref:ComEA family DNA-binding protein n=1 Tax=Alicyclobacillus tolerans TaxID=90970 RepID=UPI001F45CB01|nr:helix-hairpin-helix domain-containing protein [Alicyclobacillus tolerans]MCF8563312.1 helix-hairpin-helix domain-containing protein [Alicyclobacillus tolerans]
MELRKAKSGAAYPGVNASDSTSAHFHRVSSPLDGSNSHAESQVESEALDDDSPLWFEEVPGSMPSSLDWTSPAVKGSGESQEGPFRPGVRLRGIGVLIWGAVVLLSVAALAFWLIAANRPSLSEGSQPHQKSANSVEVQNFTAQSLNAQNRTESSNVTSGFREVQAQSEGVQYSIVVDVHGDVVHPGVYRLSASARVQDAVAAAGGFVHPEDSAWVNAAAPLDDGQEVLVPNAKLVEATAPSGTPNGSFGIVKNPGAQALNSTVSIPAPGTPGPFAGSFGTAENVPSQPIDLNTADISTLETVPEIGPSRAQAIAAYRTSHGGFHTVGELRQVRGIGPVIFSRIAAYFYVGYGQKP